MLKTCKTITTLGVVFQDMTLHVALLGGAVGAVGAGEGLLSSVGADVGPDALHLHCLEGAVRAGERLLEGVDAQVFCELDGDGGGEGTVGAEVHLGADHQEARLRGGAAGLGSSHANGPGDAHSVARHLRESEALAWSAFPAVSRYLQGRPTYSLKNNMFIIS